MKIEVLSKEIVIKNMPLFIKLGADIIPQKIQYWNKEHFLKDIDGKWEFSLVLLDDNNNIPLGFIIVSLKEQKRIHINKMVIDPQSRHRGVGSMLLKELIDRSKTACKDQISLFTHFENIKAYEFYKKNGFCVNDIITDTNNEKRYFMTLKL